MPVEVLNPASYLLTPHSIGPWVVGTLSALLGIVALLLNTKAIVHHP
jgi:hypothetical protein